MVLWSQRALRKRKKESILNALSSSESGNFIHRTTKSTNWFGRQTICLHTCRCIQGRIRVIWTSDLKRIIGTWTSYTCAAVNCTAADRFIFTVYPPGTRLPKYVIYATFEMLHSELHRLFFDHAVVLYAAQNVCQMLICMSFGLAVGGHLHAYIRHPYALWFGVFLQRSKLNTMLKAASSRSFSSRSSAAAFFATSTTDIDRTAVPAQANGNAIALASIEPCELPLAAQFLTLKNTIKFKCVCNVCKEGPRSAESALALARLRKRVH